jgi:uncharacterized protein HemY
MKKTLNILVLFIAILLTVWMVVDNDGLVSIEWLDYQVETSFVFAVLFILFLMIIFSIIFNVFSFIKKIPTRIYSKRQKKKYNQQLQFLVDSLSSDQLNDKNKSDQLLKKISLTESPFESQQLNILNIFFGAKLYQNIGLFENSNLKSNKLLQIKGAETLGYKCLIENHLTQEKYLDAMICAESMLKYCPKNNWLLQILFDLYIKLKFWIKAEKILQKLSNNLNANIHEKYIYLYDTHIKHLLHIGESSEIIANLEKGLKNNYLSLDMIKHLCRIYIEQNKNDKAYKIILESWNKKNDIKCLYLVYELFKYDNALVLKYLDEMKKKSDENDKEINITFAKIMINIQEYEKAAKILNLFIDENDSQISMLMLIISAKSNSRLSEISTWAEKVKFNENKTTFTSNN